MIIRPATHTDIPYILDIYNQAVLTSTASYDCEPNTLEMRLAWFEEHQRDNYPIIVAENESGRVVGWASLSKYRSRFGYRFTAENSIYIASDQQGCGIGKLLMSRLIEIGHEMGLHAIVAGIDARGVASMRLHEHFGFATVARFKEVGYKFGQWLDVVFMELLLAPAESAIPVEMSTPASALV